MKRPVHTYKTKIGPADAQVTVIVSYEMIPGSRGARDSLGGRAGAGAPLEPDEPAHIEITSITTLDGVQVEIDEDEEQRICETLMSRFEKQYE